MGGKVLIVDDVAANRIVMKAKLTAAGYLPLLAADGAACLAMARAERPDLILLDLVLPDMAGIEVLARLRADPAMRAIPVVMFSANPAEEPRLQAFRAGADDVLIRPLDDQTLLARIRSLLRAREAVIGLMADAGHLPALGLAEAPTEFKTPGLVALVVSRPELALRLRREIAGKSGARVVVMSVDEALAEGLKAGGAPDIFVIDADLTVQSGGLRLMSELRSRASTHHAAFALMIGPDSAVSPAMAFDLGAHDLITVQTAPQEVLLRLDRLLLRKREADRLRASVQDGLRLAVIDPLTGLHNRRYGLAQLQAIAERARETGAMFAVLVADIDRFKLINDRLGHAAGDDVLVEVAARLRRSLRAGDLIARIGGEEFLIALPDIALPDARQIAERLCRVIEESPIRLLCGDEVGATVSIGLAVSEKGEWPRQVDTVAEIIDRADRALMRSKSAGRNQVTVSRTAA
jgi:two-component system, cell cycle response regulator